MGQGVSGYHLNTSGGNGGKSSQKDLFSVDTSSKKNKFSDTETYPPDLEESKQGKHIEGHPNFIEGKSKLTITMKQAENLAEQFSGTGIVLGNSETSNKEWVDFGIIIGIYIDKEGNELPTTKGLIHHSKNGTHIVPSNPYGEY